MHTHRPLLFTRRLLAGATLIVCCCLLLACAGCLNPAAAAATSPRQLSIMSYNVQTLFDPVDNGNEYADFRLSAGSWNEAVYRQRLRALAGVVEAAVKDAPDILVLVEIENETVLADFAEQLGGYPYLACAPGSESALRCGLLSRFPVRAARSHLAELPSADSAPRYMLEVELDVYGLPLLVLVAHWKSKLGGAAETEAQRQEAALLVAAVLRQRLAERPALAYVLAGDLNENPDEFSRVGKSYPTALMPCAAGDGPWLRLCSDSTLVADIAAAESVAPSTPAGTSAEAAESAAATAEAAASPAGSSPEPASLLLYSPWEEAGGYSYQYGGLDERIDHLLFSPSLLADSAAAEPALHFQSFSAQPPAFAVSESGTPLAWRSGQSGGYSDHLPVYATLEWRPGR